MHRILATLVVVGLFLGGCSSKQTPDDERPSDEKQETNDPEEAEVDWNGFDRLGDRVVPKSYDLELTVDPTRKRFSGEARIRARIEKPVETIRMHAEDLEFSETSVTRGGETLSASFQSVDNGGLVVRFDETVESGVVTMQFTYDAPLDTVPEGLYRVKDGGNWYAYTQLEPLEAREMFPCFDEPTFKTPFTVSVTVPKGMMAAGNAPRTTKEPVRDAEMVRYQFTETEPLPTYLVAIAVGDFDVVSAEDVVPEGDRLSNVPVRVLTTKGRGDLAEYALRATPDMVRFQEEYFGIDFPYKKMDLVAVPNFSAGAMENVGLVTFRESILLLDEERASVKDRYWAQSVMAHEYAHMWFGNLVTLSWWDELWLNESFATWMGGRTVREVSPELEPEIRAVQNRSDVIRSDSLKKARAIRQPIESGGDVYNAFSSITYSKGAAVLRMFESWMGEEGFRKGVRSYLEANRHGTGHTKELLAAFSEAAGKPVDETIGTFLNQPGAPLVRVDYDRDQCEEKGTARLTLRQSRYLPAGSRAEEVEAWDIPMCIRYGDGEGNTNTQCLLFDGSEGDEQQQTVELDSDGCPVWIHPNADERGYYHWQVEPRDRQRELLKHRSELELPERVALLGHLSAQMRAEALSPAAYLKAMRTMADSSHRAIVKQIIDSLKSFEDVVYRGDPPEAFRAYVRELLGRHYERVGFEPKPDETSGDALLRGELVETIATLGGAEEVTERARKVTTDYLDDPESVDASVVKYAMDIAAHDGDEKLWKKLRGALDRVERADMRGEILAALGAFNDPELVRKSLDLFLTDAVRSQNFWRLAGAASGDPKTVDVAWTWMTENFGSIREKVGKASAGRLPWMGSGYCSKDARGKVKDFFSTKEHRTMTTGRNLAKLTQSISQCAAFRSVVEKPVRSDIESWYEETDASSDETDGGEGDEASAGSN